MTTRGLYVFEHESALGNAQAHNLFERIKPGLKDPSTIPRNFLDYTVQVEDDATLPKGVRLLCKVG
ncbi:MAG: type I CRISPR-associated protein Cas7 [Pseudomonadota bacterium]